MIDMTIDEAIAREREMAERNLILLDSDELIQKSYDTYLRAEYHEQIVMWLEELKVLKENSNAIVLYHMALITLVLQCGAVKLYILARLSTYFYLSYIF